MTSQQTETFASLFSQPGRTFEIPAYQRAYSWGKTEIDQFITDLREVKGNYYLGHYLFERDQEADGSHLHLIDGQQRLTTCIIFFSSLCNELSARAAKDTTISLEQIAAFRATYLLDEATKLPKLKTVASDNNFFREEIILRELNHSQVDDTASKKRIRIARKLIDAAVSSMDYSAEDLITWANLIQDATVSHLIVTSKTKAAQIFAFQNDRGKKLTNLEILKSYLMLQILLSNQSSGSIDDCIKGLEEYFKNIYSKIEQVQGINEDEVLAYYWRSTTRTPYDDAPVVAGIKKDLSNQPTDKQVRWIEKFVAGLANAFTFVQQIESEPDEFARDLRDLNRMALAYPVLLRAYRDGIDESTKKRLFQFLENITFRNLLRGGRVDLGLRFHHHFFNQDEALASDNLNARINDFIGHLKDKTHWWWGYWNNDTLAEYLNASFYGNPVDNYVLWKYERHISPKDYKRPPSTDYKQLMSNESIEHIAPQTPQHDDENVHLSDYGVYDDAVVPSDGIRSGSWLNRLGNLMLISQSQNSRMGNRPFATKLKVIQSESLLQQHKRLTDFLAPKHNGTPEKRVIWDKTAIERRHKDIVKAALEIWDLNRI